MIKAECVAASKCQTKIATFKVTMPRYILAEFNTHRVFSRNSASSRAIPFSKMVGSVEENPYIPLAWQKDHKGMQGTEYFTKEEIDRARILTRYSQGEDYAIQIARELNREGITKQITNRFLEPFMYHTVLVTATESENFFELRCPRYTLSTGGVYKSKKDVYKDFPLNGISGILQPNDPAWFSLNKGQADIHMMAVAEAIYDAWNEADFKELAPREWHLPYGDTFDEERLLGLYNGRIVDGEMYFSSVEELKIMISVARCARLSYQTLGDESKIDYVSDIKLYYNLKRNGHWSPFEHVAQAMSSIDWITCIKTIINKNGKFEHEEGWLANFRGWIQQRAILENAA